ncbi:MAG: ferritin-like domain-containing protein [Actinomycetota bacterium]|nr:ferritin-like domain-containing protein [Actinomycetota bacterium]
MTRNRKTPQMAISEAELNSMTAELDMLHKETFPGVHKTLDEFSANLAHLNRKPAARRTFLLGMGGAVAVGTLAACSSSKTSTGSTPASSSATGGTYTGDLKVVALAAALENLAVTAYQGALTMATAGKFGAVPPAVGTFVTVAMAQHKDHSAAWNAVLKSAGKPTISGAPLTITATEVAKLQAAKSIPDVAKLALSLENAAAETYTFAAENVTDAGGIMTAATIQPVETMHAAILSFVLGQYPVPVSFIGTSNAVQPSALTA